MAAPQDSFGSTRTDVAEHHPRITSRSWRGALGGLALVNLPITVGFALAMWQDRPLWALAAIPLAVVLGWLFVRAGGRMVAASIFAMAPGVLLVSIWGQAEALLGPPEPVTIAGLRNHPAKLLEVRDGGLRGDLMGVVRSKNQGRRPDSHSFVVPLVPDGWTTDQPVPAWAVCRADTEKGHEGGRKHCRAAFMAERRVGRRRDDRRFRAAIRNAESVHGVRSAPGAVLLDWDPDLGSFWNVLPFSLVLVVLSAFAFKSGFGLGGRHR